MKNVMRPPLNRLLKFVERRSQNEIIFGSSRGTRKSETGDKILFVSTGKVYQNVA